MRLALATLIAVVVLAAPAYAQHPSSAKFVYTDLRASLDGTETNDATVALGATVRFEFPEGTATHNVNLERPGPECTQLAGAGSRPAQPHPAELARKARAGSIECRFDTPGVYHFGSDDNGTHVGVVRVANADGSVPIDTPAPHARAAADLRARRERLRRRDDDHPAGLDDAAHDAEVDDRRLAARQRGRGLSLTGGSARRR